jgi:hypothetical protein
MSACVFKMRGDNYSEIHIRGPLFSKLADKPLNSGWRGNYAGLFSHQKIFVVIKEMKIQWINKILTKSSLLVQAPVPLEKEILSMVVQCRQNERVRVIMSTHPNKSEFSA